MRTKDIHGTRMTLLCYKDKFFKYSEDHGLMPITLELAMELLTANGIYEIEMYHYGAVSKRNLVGIEDIS